jgi:hypothetical protein
MSADGCGAVVRMAAFGGACATDTAGAITADTAGDTIEDTGGDITAAALVRGAGLYKTESASRIVATETPLEAASVGGLSLSERVGNPDVRYWPIADMSLCAAHVRF